MADVILFKGEVSSLYRTSMAPWGLLYVASPLVSRGYDVAIIDGSKDKKWRQHLASILKERPICVGVSSMTGYEINGALEFSRTIREYGDIPIVWGGVHPTIFPEQPISESVADVVVRGEGEETFAELVEAFEKGGKLDNIKGISYLKDGRITHNERRGYIDLNNFRHELPFHLIDMERYIVENSHLINGAKRVITAESSRGCSRRCAYCFNHDSGWRALDGQRLSKLTLDIVKRFRVDGIHWEDSNFFEDMQRVTIFCETISREALNIKWSANCRVDYLYSYDASFMKKITRSGCSKLRLGCESGSQRILDLLNKGIRIEQIIEVNQMLRDYCIDSSYNFMFGFPNETIQDLSATLKLMERLANDNPRAKISGISLYTPYPATPLYADMLRLGFRPPEKLCEWADANWGTIDQINDAVLSFKNEDSPAEKDKNFIRIILFFARCRFLNPDRSVRRWFKFRIKMIIKFPWTHRLVPELYARKIWRFVKKLRHLKNV